MYVITNSEPSTGYDFHIESPDQIIANKNQSGASTSGDWDIIENDSSAETDPVFTASPANGVTSQLISQWNTAYNRGDRRNA